LIQIQGRAPRGLDNGSGAARLATETRFDLLVLLWRDAHRTNSANARRAAKGETPMQKLRAVKDATDCMVRLFFKKFIFQPILLSLAFTRV
jgi:hypothetical protein